MLIGEVSRRSGVSVRMLRHYDSVGLLRPSGHTVGGHREYSHGDLRRLFHVESLRSLGLTLRQVREALESTGFDPQELVADLIAATRARIEAQEELLTRLRHVESSGVRDWEQALGVVDLLRHLSSADPATRQRAALTDPSVNDARADVGALTEAALRERVPNVAGALRWALAHVGGADPDQLTAALSSDDSGLRRQAVDILVDTPASADRQSLLVSAMEHHDEEVRARAALALGAAGDAVATQELVRMVVAGVRDVDAADALRTLSETPEAAGTIAGHLADHLATPDQESAARIRLLQALHELPHPRATEALRTASSDRDGDVARVAAAFLASRPGDS